MNASETYDLVFPETSGFDKSKIFFYRDRTDLKDFFYNNDFNIDRQRHIFVTDRTIADLNMLKPFVSLFNKTGDCVYTYQNDILVILGAGEKYKTIDNILLIIKAALDANFTRNCIFTAIGGGVICDMTGFAASMFKRGVDVEFVPTTLLAMVDASIGGKTGCDFDGYKNMIGSFYPAKRIYFFVPFIMTLSEREYKSGLAEAIKTAFLFNKDLCLIFENSRQKILNRDIDTLYIIIKECVKAKANVVHKDFREKGERAYLNLGHTFGHALESTAGLGDITHGEGVAWGMSRAACLSYKKGFCSKEYMDKVIDLLSDYGYDVSPVPSCLENNKKNINLLLTAMHKDKKNQSSSLSRFTLQKDFCSTFMTEIEDSVIETVLQ